MSANVPFLFVDTWLFQTPSFGNCVYLPPNKIQDEETLLSYLQKMCTGQIKYHHYVASTLTQSPAFLKRPKTLQIACHHKVPREDEVYPENLSIPEKEKIFYTFNILYEVLQRVILSSLAFLVVLFTQFGCGY